jgi:hypothetical protein
MSIQPALHSEARFTRAFEDLMRDGYVILPEAISHLKSRLICAEVAPHLAATPKCVGDFYGWKTTRVGGLLNKAPSTQDLVLHPGVLAITHAALQPSCDCIQLNLTQAIRVHPQERAQAPHRDEEMWPHEPKLRPWLVNVMWPLTAFTEENGATRLWPGSHADALDRSIDPARSIAAEMQPGDALDFPWRVDARRRREPVKRAARRDHCLLLFGLVEAVRKPILGLSACGCAIIPRIAAAAHRLSDAPP